MAEWFRIFKTSKFYVGTDRLHVVQIFVTDTFPNFFYMFFIKILTKKPHFFLISPTESIYLVVKFLSAMQRKFSWHSFLGGRKKNMVCVFVLGIFSNFQAI